MTNEMLANLVMSIVAGLVSGGVVSLLFYLLAGRDLTREVRELRRLNGVVIRALRDANAEVEYDEHGAPVRLHFRLNPEGVILAFGDIDKQVGKSVGGEVKPTGSRTFEFIPGDKKKR